MQLRLVVCYRRFGSTYRSHLQAMGMTDNLDDESMPNHLVAYSVQIIQMRQSPHERLVGVSKSPNMFQLSSKLFQAE